MECSSRPIVAAHYLCRRAWCLWRTAAARAGFAICDDDASWLLAPYVIRSISPLTPVNLVCSPRDVPQTELKRRKRFVQESRENLRRVKSALSSSKTLSKLDQDRRAVRDKLERAVVGAIGQEGRYGGVVQYMPMSF